jgi:tetratricopeptide (TPR) repeat protein
LSNNEKQDEKELWQRIPNTQGTDRAETFVALSHIAYDRGDHKACLALCESAREIYEQLGAETSTAALMHVYEGITWSLRKLDRDEEAAELALHAVDILKENNPMEAADMMRDAGRFYFAAEKYEKSLQCHQNAIAEIDPDTTDFTMGIDSYNCGFALIRMEKYAESLEYMFAARTYLKKAKEPEKVYYCDEYLAVAYIALNNGVEATTHAQKSLDFALTAQNDCLEAWARYRLGCAKVLLGEVDEAEELLRKSLRITVNACSPDWELAIDLEKEIANILVIKGRVEEADEIRRRIATLEETMKDEEPSTKPTESEPKGETS